MTVEVAILVSAVSLGFAIYSGVTNMKRNKATDDKKEATEMTTVIVKLEAAWKAINKLQDKGGGDNSEP